MMIGSKSKKFSLYTHIISVRTPLTEKCLIGLLLFAPQDALAGVFLAQR
jgi:hypothetical protein